MEGKGSTVFHCWRLFPALVAGPLVLVGLLLWLSLSPGPVLADPGVLFVKPDGAGTACTQSSPCDLQTALVQAFDGDTIYVATGTYTGTGDAVITVTKSITLYGGWDGCSTGEVVRDPEAYPTTLDGENGRRVVYIDGYITLTLDGFIITRGNASKVTSNSGRGGGICSINASPLIINNVITNNIAYTGTVTGFGGGIYLIGASTPALISGNLILSNTANTIAQGKGGGLGLVGSIVTVRDNIIQDNIAGFTINSMGGGVAALGGSGRITLSDNQIQGNKGTPSGSGFGGGFYAQFGAHTLMANLVVTNAASAGDGLYLETGFALTLTNNLLVQNAGEGASFDGNATYPSSGRLAHNTFAQNGDRGIRLMDYVTVTLTNNVIVSHTTGIYVSSGSTATLQATLWGTGTWANGTDWVALGTILTGTVNIWGDPAFVAPDAGDYHIGPASAAIDAGVDAGVATDIDGDTRPIGSGYDIGADELPLYVYLPLVMKGSL